MVTVDKTKCLGCGTCVSLCPGVFTLGTDGKSEVAHAEACGTAGNDCQQALDGCPTQAISLS
jgi:ferredoxin